MAGGVNMTGDWSSSCSHCGSEPTNRMRWKVQLMNTTTQALIWKPITAEGHFTGLRMFAKAHAAQIRSQM